MEKGLKEVAKEMAKNSRIPLTKLRDKLNNYHISLEDVEASDMIVNIINLLLQKGKTEVVIDFGDLDYLPDGVGYALCQIDLAKVKILASEKVRNSMEWVYKFHRDNR